MISGMAWAGPAIMSKYGTIQGVDGYSTNPFWSSNTSTYSNRMPVPVYENGPDVQTDECLKIVSNFVSAQCNALNNCADTSLSDIRPAIILQLSRMSGGNYATSCSGYLDEIFRQYKQAHQTPGASATFPTPSTTAKAAATNTNKSAVPLNNFFDAQKPAWAIEMQERATELAEFQADNDRFYPELVPMDFPKTYADLSFGERMANNKAGYEPYQGKSAFKPIQVEDLDKYEKRQAEIATAKQKKEQANDKKNLSPEEYCKKYPNDTECIKKAEEEEKQLCDAQTEQITALETKLNDCIADNKKELTDELQAIKNILKECKTADNINNDVSTLETNISKDCHYECTSFEEKYFTGAKPSEIDTPYQVNSGHYWDNEPHDVWDFDAKPDAETDAKTNACATYTDKKKAYEADLKEYKTLSGKEVNYEEFLGCKIILERLNEFNQYFDTTQQTLQKFANTDNLFLKEAEYGYKLTESLVKAANVRCNIKHADGDGLIETETVDDAIECAKNYIMYLTNNLFNPNAIICTDPDETTDEGWDDIIRCEISNNKTNGYTIHFVFGDIDDK